MKALRRLAGLVCLGLALVRPLAVRGEGQGQEDLDDAVRAKVTAEDLGDLNRVIERLESALDKGLDLENSDFAEQMLAETLLERASQLTTVVRSQAGGRVVDERLEQVQALATSDLRRVLTYDNPPPQATAMLAQLLSLRGGDEREARQLLNQLVKQPAFAALPPAERAESFALRATLQKAPERALADYAEAISLDPENVGYLLARANFHREQKDVDKALADVAAVVAKRPDDATAFLLQAEILRGADRLDDALASLEKAAKLASDQPTIFQTRGEILRQQDKLDAAIAEFSKVLQLAPGLALALIHRAEAYYAADKLDEALADLETLLKEHPGLAVAHGLRAQVLAGKKRLPEAIDEMEKLAKALPEQTEYRMQLGLYYLLNEQPRRAIAAYGEVLALDANHFLALRSRGDAYLNIGDHAAAVADFARAIEIAGDDSPLLNNYAWVLATSPDDAVRDAPLAIKLATRACELTKYEQPHIISTLAAAYAESGDFDAARKWSQQAVDKAAEGAGADIKEELAKELASYEQNKPWRERQTQDDAPSPAAEGPEGAAAAPGESARSSAEASPPPADP